MGFAALLIISGELNDAISTLLVQLNRHPFRKMAGCRQTLFDTLDKPELRPLPSRPFEHEEWKKATVNIDYHVAFDEHYYSVPYRLVRETVFVRATDTVVEVYHRSMRVATHIRSYLKYRHTTIAEHMPDAHRWQAEWTPVRLVEWGRQSGAHVAELFEAIMSTKVHPEQGYRACLGIMRLGNKVGSVRLNAACRRAMAIGGVSYSCVRTILEHGQEHAPLPSDITSDDIGLSIGHENVRGSAYYRQTDGEVADAA